MSARRSYVESRRQHVRNTLYKINLSLCYKVITTRNQYASPKRGYAIPAGPWSDFDETVCCCWIPIGPLC